MEHLGAEENEDSNLVMVPLGVPVGLDVAVRVALGVPVLLGVGVADPDGL